MANDQDNNVIKKIKEWCPHKSHFSFCYYNYTELIYCIDKYYMPEYIEKYNDMTDDIIIAEDGSCRHKEINEHFGYVDSKLNRLYRRIIHLFRVIESVSDKYKESYIKNAAQLHSNGLFELVDNIRNDIIECIEKMIIRAEEIEEK